MITLEISWEEIKFFIALVIAGAGYGAYTYYKGKRVGFDDAIYQLRDVGIVDIDDETFEIRRVSDREFKKYQEDFCDE